MQFPEPKDLELDWKDTVLDGKSKSFGQYDVANPHPGFGKDPNILNEFGHTKFPMWADAQTIVNNEEELAAYKAAKEPKLEILKDDGPTVEDYVKAGYKASTYPPAGYSSKSSEEEIKTAIAAEVNPWPSAK